MPHATEGAFPNDGIFSRLLELCKERDGIIIDDPTIGVQATYRQLLTDVEQMRLKLLRNLKKADESTESLIEENYHIGYVGHANYEYTVSAFATLALGGVIIPLPLTIEEQNYGKVLEKCDLKCILAGRNYEHQAAAFQKCANSRLSSPIDLLSIVFNTPQDSLTSVGIDESFQIPDTTPAWVNWTSGSTGVPKGAIHDRRLFTKLPKQFDQVTIAHRPAFYIAGTMAMIQSVFIGRHVSVVRMNPGPDVLWERFRQGGVTTITATVAFYDALARYFRSHLDASPHRKEYLQGMSSFKNGFVGGSMPVPSLLKYWRDVLGGPLSVAWGSTEIGGLLTIADPEASINMERCMGKLQFPTHTIKLSEGDHGTLLVKGNSTFKGYLWNEPPYHQLVDKQGFFITGDTAHLDGDYYIFDGRTSSDFIKAVGGPVPVIYMENTISKLPYIDEIYVLPVTDKSVGSRVGVLARCPGFELTLSRLREDLVEIVPAFMLPTALRVLRTGEEIERVHSEKIARIPTVEKFFGGNSGAELWDLRF